MKILGQGAPKLSKVKEMLTHGWAETHKNRKRKGRKIRIGLNVLGFAIKIIVFAGLRSSGYEV